MYSQKRMEIITIFRNYSWLSAHFLGHVQLTVHNLGLIQKTKVFMTSTWNLYLSVKHLNCLDESTTERDNYHFICLELDSWNICNGAVGLMLFIRDYIQRNQEKQTINLRYLLFNTARPHAYHHPARCSENTLIIFTKYVLCFWTLEQRSLIQKWKIRNLHIS
jgi:hypothetical protein